MTPAPSEQSVFAEVILLATPEARAAYLDSACGTDAALRQRVEALLRAAESAGDFLEEPPTGLGGDAESTLVVGALGEKPGDRIGRYKLLQQIGEGGCGVVYMAEQEEPVRRRVALKVIKLGMDTKSVIARFEAERQALALMDHPNIAKVLDAGATETGRPYFVMELVRGIKITDYCDENNLSTTERLKLFTQVCQAIQHAHQKGIIHRDIKPSNVLVTQNEKEPVPKVIDFGIAKATTDQRLTDKTVFTAFEQFIGTPAYMSPEQAMMTSLDIDTRTDIYALGVLLYELLTGTTPFDADDLMAVGLDAMRRIIREQEPARPSTKLSETLVAADAGPLHSPTGRPATEEEVRASSRRLLRLKETIPLLRGDLDWIVMKALEKDRTRRYETATGLAADVQRHLSNEPVTARPPSVAYRFHKLVRRNKLAFGAVVAVMLALVLGIVVSSWQAIRAIRAEQAQIELRETAEAEKKKAQIEAVKSDQVSQFLKETFSGANPFASNGRDRTLMREILDAASKRIDKELIEQPEVQAELQTLMGSAYSTAGEPRKAERLERAALATWRQLGRNDRATADTLEELSSALRLQNKYSEAESLIREALAIRRNLWPDGHARTSYALRNLAFALWKQGKLKEAEATARESVAMRRRLHGNEDAGATDPLNILAQILRDQGQLEEAEALSREALASLRNASPNDSIQMAEICGGLSSILSLRGKSTEAIALQRKAVDMDERLLGVRHAWTAVAREQLVALLVRDAHYEEAEALLRNYLILAREPDASISSRTNARLGRILHLLADVLCAQNKLTEARSLAEEASAFYQSYPDWTSRDYRDASGVLTAVLTELGDFNAVEALHRNAVDHIRALAGPDDPQLAFALAGLARALLLTHKDAEAEPLARECLAIRLMKTPDDWLTFEAHSILAGSLLAQKKHAEVERILTVAYEGMKQRENKIPLRHRTRLRECLQRLVQLYEATGQSGQAAGWKQKLAEFDQAEAARKAGKPNP